jgi:hypothetical protein
MDRGVAKTDLLFEAVNGEALPLHCLANTRMISAAGEQQVGDTPLHILVQNPAAMQ